VPNQEKVINRAIRVTYHDKPENLLMILLPNRELMQANFVPIVNNSFEKRRKQEWELLWVQSGTIPETGWPGFPRTTRQLPGLVSSRALCFPDRPVEPAPIAVESGHSTM
jgi:hypothetical protein